MELRPSRANAQLEVERILVTHGDPVLRTGGRELAASLEQVPCRRSSLY